MARTNPLGKIKDLAFGTLKVPVTVAGSALGLAKGAVSIGRTAGGDLASTATKKAAGAPSAKQASAPQPEPVNVTEELGLDPAPVTKPKPKPAKKTPPKRKPTTTIDAAADPSKVDATPADVAEVVAKTVPASAKSAK